MPNARIKIYAISYNVAHTGFTRVMHSILSHLDSRQFEVHYLGIGGGKAMYGQQDNVKIYPHDPRKEGDVFRSYLAKDLMEKDPPDILFVINDLWMFKPYDRILRQFRERTKFVTYTPFDGTLEDPSYLRFFEKNDSFVTYTKFGRRETEKGLKELRLAGKISDFPSIATIPHGVDRQRFFPKYGKPDEANWTAGRKTAKRKVFGPELAATDSFIVLNANRPTPRKRMDLTIEGFTRFAGGKPKNVKLCLHHALLMPEEKKEIEALVNKWKINDRLIWSTVNHPEEHFSDAQLNELYNACDVGINTSQGEGWGMIAFEHAATGAAQIVPSHSACGELWSSSALVLPTAKKRQEPPHPMAFREVTATDVAAALERLYTDRQFLRNMSKKAYENACRPEYSWQCIGKQWGGLFKQVAHEKPSTVHRQPSADVAV